MEKAIRSFLITSLYAFGLGSADIIVLLGITRDIFDYNLQKVGGAKAFPTRPKSPFKDVFERYIQLTLLLEENDERQKQLHHTLARWLKVDLILEFTRGLLFAQEQLTVYSLGEKDAPYLRLLEWLGCREFAIKNTRHYVFRENTTELWNKFLSACGSGEYRMPSSQEGLRERLAFFANETFDRSKVVLPLVDGQAAEALRLALSELTPHQRMRVENAFLGAGHPLEVSKERKAQLLAQASWKLRKSEAIRGLFMNMRTIQDLQNLAVSTSHTDNT